MNTVVYNEGIGFGGFQANFATAGLTFVERFNPTHPTKKITRPDVLGGANAALGAGFVLILDFSTATATIQTNAAAVPAAPNSSIPQGTPTIVQNGDYFTDPFESKNWVVESVEPAFDMGSYWTQQIRLAKETAS